MTIHIFNPETDYALASFSPYYTPPAEVMNLRREMALLPLKWASAGDAILVPDSTLRDAAPATPGIALLAPADLPLFMERNPEARISPWGWNPMLRHSLIEAGVSEERLPSLQWLESLRRISHRRSTIEFNRRLNSLLERAGVDRRHLTPLPVEFTDPEDAMHWEADHRPAYFKAPWSSSGRGVLFTEELDVERHISPWIHGIIRRQGSVMAETAAPKALDFATEWRASLTDGHLTLEYLGVSVFEASKRGKYHSNVSATQRVLMERIRSVAPDFDHRFIEAQREALRALILDNAAECDATDPSDCIYQGYIGIDMLAAPDGSIRGGIELNFRRTMGVPMPEVCVIGTGNVGSHLYEAFRMKNVDVINVSGRCSEFPPAEIYIVCVKDDVVADVYRRIVPPEGAIVAHTSGSVPLDRIKGSLPDGSGYGVFYPLQTFSKGVTMDYSKIPFLIEGSDAPTVKRLMNLAEMISANVCMADSEERAQYHVAAVLTCNFANHLCTLADRYLSDHGLDFRMLLPLLRQTIEKLESVRPAEAQTGPAARGDSEVIASHLRRLAPYPDITKIYKLITDSILKK